MKLQLSAFKQEINKLTQIELQSFHVKFLIPVELDENMEFEYGSIDIDYKEKTIYIHLESEG